MKKLFSVLLVALMVTCLLFAAGGKDNAAKGSGSVIPKETVELSVYTQLANYSGEQIGWYGKILKDKFNVKLNIINAGDGSIFPTRMAAGDLGDIVVFGDDKDEYQQAVQAGLLWDWNDEDLLAEHGKYINEHMQKALAKNASISGGKVYGYGHNVAPNADAHDSFFYHPDIRWDLYAQLGYPKVNTLEDYIDILDKMVKLCPKSDKGSKTYGVSLFPDWDGDMVMFVKATACLYGYDEFGFGLYNVMTDKYEHLFIENSQYFRCLKFYNKLFQKGLLDPDSMTQKSDLHTEKYLDGAAMFCIFDWMASGTYNTPEHKAAGKAMLPCPPDDAKMLAYGLNVNGGNRIWTIGAKTQYPELCMELINWFSTPEGVMTKWYGPKGITWDYNEEGKPYLTELGLTCQTNKETELNVGGYTGTYRDGEEKINNTTWNQNAINPEGNGENYLYETWESYISDDVEPIIKDWRKYTGVKDFDDYIGRPGHYSVAPGTTYTTRTKSDELQTTWKQVAECIKTYSWQAIYAKTDAEYDAIVKEMETRAYEYGYEECRQFMEEEGKIRAALCKAAKE